MIIVDNNKKRAVTIGITSFNRGKYLDVLLRSIKEESINENHEVIVVDNCSTESRVHRVINTNQTWIDEYYDRGAFAKPNWTNDEYIAKNIIIKRASNPVIIFLQDDLQFIGPRGSIKKYADALLDSPFKCLTANGVRRSTLEVKHTFLGRRYHGVKLWRYNDNHFHTMGFFKKDVFAKIGEYPTNWPQTQAYWGRSEDWYDNAVKQNWPDVPISATAQVPLFLPVWNDPRGGYAFLRSGKRFGHYLEPVDESRLYYDQMSREDWTHYESQNFPQSFVDVAKPLGWTLPLSSNSDPLKYPQSKVMIEGPISEIDA